MLILSEMLMKFKDCGTFYSQFLAFNSQNKKEHRVFVNPIVQKYGGTSLANPERLTNVAKRIKESYDSGSPVVVVVSAQGGTTDSLIEKAREVNPQATRREIDMLLVTGEQQSAALLAMAVQKLGLTAVSLNAAQVGIEADGAYGNAQIEKVKTHRIYSELAQGKVVIVTGFQGVNNEDDLTTLGRGASDTTAIALAAVLKSPVCEIYTDVNGIYTADPRIVPNAIKLSSICYDDMIDLASSGVNKPHNRAVEMAKRYNVLILVCSSTGTEPGTYIKEDIGVERLSVSGLAIDRNVAQISLSRVVNKPDSTFKVFDLLAKANIFVDVVIASASTKGICFTVRKQDLEDTMEIIGINKEVLGFEEVSYNENLAKLSIVGAGMSTNSGVAASMFEAVYECGAEISMISTSETKISVLINEKQITKAAASVHEKFLDAFR